MKLNANNLRETAFWTQAGVRLPRQNLETMRAATEQAPVWVHFGAGNIFRGFIAGLQQQLLDSGEQSAGILAVETFDAQVIDRIYRPYDNLALTVSLRADGGMDKAINASIARGFAAGREEDLRLLRQVFRAPSLQLLSYTITEKGYALRDMRGELTAPARHDLTEGPAHPMHAMGVTAALLLERYLHGAPPIAVVSMDNCSHNGEKLKAGVVEMAEGWIRAGFAPAEFGAWLQDESKVSFPWSMIDKITPRPDAQVATALEQLGIEDMQAIVTDKNTYIAPFVNAEVPQYLVIEDRFPNGRPALERAGVYMTDRDTVNRTERMKVTTCLNPLHTAMAIYGCLLGYRRICDEMQDEDITALIRQVGYNEGLKVVTDPGIIHPKAFIDEVIGVRLPNPFMPDTPQRIACDTSQKVSVRFGETLKSYQRADPATLADLKGIPLALAGWLRYLLGVDDRGEEMPISPDPMLEQLREALRDVSFGRPETAENARALLSNAQVFGLNLEKAGLSAKILGYLAAMLQGPGAVRHTLHAALAE